MKRIVFLTSSGLAILFFILYMSILSHILYYHEQHRLFLFSEAYLINTVNSRGLLEYFTDFMIQFFYFPWLGSLLLSLLLASVYGMIAYSTFRITGKTDFLHFGLLPVIYLFLQTLSVDYKISSIVAWIFSLSIISMAVGLSAGRWKYVAAVSGCLLLLTFISWETVVLAAASISLSSLSAYYFRSLKKKRVLTVGFSAMSVYVCAGIYCFSGSYRVGERYMVLARKSAYERNWNKTAEMTEHYLSSGHKNIVMLYYHNIALFHTGRLGDNLLDIPQTFGVPALCFPWRSNSRDTEFGQDVYYELGHWNAAVRWASEALAIWGETAPCLINLIKCNMEIKREAVARRYVNVLKQSLFYRKTAEYFEKELASIRDEPVADNVQIAHFTNGMDILHELEYLCEHHPENRMAFEYYMVSLLLSNQVLNFAQNLYRMKAFDYRKMPKVYDEALFMCKIMEKEEFDKLGIDVNPKTEDRFKRYYELYKQGNRKGLDREFKNSYWYYIHFVSPYGDKILMWKNTKESQMPLGGLEH
ncbi:MAG: DUF6057 family protein [Dysgonamonadaceae bacterium]|jgi:tetratricopeptide (TPR) repeat protein|nr:DUF6057 family protein [Dysgonamonadaceae bacterium]